MSDLQKQMPDYYKLLSEPWHIAKDWLREFVNDEERELSDWDHVRNLFAIAADAERRASEHKADSLRWQEIAEDYRKERDEALERDPIPCPHSSGVTHRASQCVFCERDDLRAKLAKAEKERDEARQAGDEYIAKTDPVLDRMEQLSDDNDDLRAKLDAARAEVHAKWLAFFGDGRQKFGPYDHACWDCKGATLIESTREFRCAYHEAKRAALEAQEKP